MRIDLSERVAIVTGAGQGLGRAHALELARRGAKLVVNDLAPDNGGQADVVAAEIASAGGTAVPFAANVTDTGAVEDMAEETLSRWGRIDILVNNAGMLRDRSFLKMSLEEFRAVVDVHLIGSASCTKAVWPTMREQAFGRIVMTTSGTGLYGNFGQANYAAAKMAMVGLMHTLHIEGEKHNIRVNCLAPTAGAAMLEGLISDQVFETLTPESVSPGVAFLVSENAPSRTILCAGGGCFSVYRGMETEGVALDRGTNTAENIAEAWEEITDRAGMRELDGAFRQTERFAAKSRYRES